MRKNPEWLHRSGFSFILGRLKQPVCHFPKTKLSCQRLISLPDPPDETEIHYPVCLFGFNGSFSIRTTENNRQP